MSSGIKYEFIDIAMERMVWKTGQFFHSFPVVVNLVSRFPIALSVRIWICQDSSPAGVQPVARVRRAMARCETFGDGFGGTFVV